MQKKHKGTEAAISYIEEISVDLRGKRTVSKRCLTQKKVLPKRLKRLHRDLMRTNPETTNYFTEVILQASPQPYQNFKTASFQTRIVRNMREH